MSIRDSRTSTGAVHVAGAGPAGLAAAITLARAGRAVVVHEAQREVGHRFRGDFQGLENWTTEGDVLEELRGGGIATDFPHRPCRRLTAFDAWGEVYEIESAVPFFYLVERGPGPGSLDTALLAQARSLGVEVRFGERLERLAGPGILAAGPRAADAIAVGYHCETTLGDGFWAICDDALAPQGYAYLLVAGGRATVKSCMFSGFRDEQRYVRRTVEAFRRLVGFEMIDPRPHGGAANFCIPASACHGRHPLAGEQAGFQDSLWGFGMRLAMASGILAARSVMDDIDYNALWRRRLGPQLSAAAVNRALYGMLGNRGYRRWLLRPLARQRDPRAFLRRRYAPTWIKRALAPWVRMRDRGRRRDSGCDHVDCACVWCRCRRQGEAG